VEAERLFYFCGICDTMCVVHVAEYCVVDDAVLSGEQLLNLIKQSPSSDKKHHGREDRGRAVPSKARPASELEAEWRKEVDAKKAAEDETRRLEEEKRQQEEEKAEQERRKKVHSIQVMHGCKWNIQICCPEVDMST